MFKWLGVIKGVNIADRSNKELQAPLDDEKDIEFLGQEQSQDHNLLLSHNVTKIRNLMHYLTTHNTLQSNDQNEVKRLQLSVISSTQAPGETEESHRERKCGKLSRETWCSETAESPLANYEYNRIFSTYFLGVSKDNLKGKLPRQRRDKSHCSSCSTNATLLRPCESCGACTGPEPPKKRKISTTEEAINLYIKYQKKLRKKAKCDICKTCKNPFDKDREILWYPQTVLEKYNPCTDNPFIRMYLMVAILMFIGTLAVKEAVSYYHFGSTYYGTDRGTDIYEMIVPLIIVPLLLVIICYIMFAFKNVKRKPILYTAYILCVAAHTLVLGFGVWTLAIPALFMCTAVNIVLITTLLTTIVMALLSVFPLYDYKNPRLVTVAAIFSLIFVTWLSFMVWKVDDYAMLIMIYLLSHFWCLCIAWEILLITNMKANIIFDDNDFILAGYMLFMSPVDILMRLYQVEKKLSRY